MSDEPQEEHLPVTQVVDLPSLAKLGTVVLAVFGAGFTLFEKVDSIKISFDEKIDSKVDPIEKRLTGLEFSVSGIQDDVKEIRSKTERVNGTRDAQHERVLRLEGDLRIITDRLGRLESRQGDESE